MSVQFAENFFLQNKTMRKKKYCSRKCQNTGNTRLRKGMDIKGNYPSVLCKYCETEFTPRSKANIFCKPSCKNIWNASKKYNYSYQKEYRSRSPKNFMAQLRSYYNRKETLSLDFLVSLYERQDGKCALSGIEMTHETKNGKCLTNISIDRINSSIGYEEENVQLVCYAVNIMKSDKTMEDFLFWCDKVLVHERRK